MPTPTELNNTIYPHNYSKFMVFALALIGSIYLANYNYLLFHTLAELYTIIISFAVALVVLNTRTISENSFFSFIGISFAFSGLFDLLHTLVYQGMGVFPNATANLAPQMWLVARYIDSLTLLASSIFLNKQIKLYPLITSYSVIAILLVLSILQWNTFPVCWVDGQGLTSFKIISEYIICVILLLAIVLLFKNRNKFHQKVFLFLCLSYATTIGTELSLTFYNHMYGFANLVGHIFKMASYLFLYEAIIETSLREPYKLLFFEIQKKTKQLQHLSYHDALTGLYNRSYFEEYMNRPAKTAAPVSLLSIDLDGLKFINDHYGHEMGDTLLKTASNLLIKTFRQTDIIARVGGDEFIVILPNTTLSEAEHFVGIIDRELDHNNVNTTKLPIFMSIGCASSLDDQPDLAQILRQADSNMYKIKALKHKEKLEKLMEFYQARK